MTEKKKNSRFVVYYSGFDRQRQSVAKENTRSVERILLSAFVFQNPINPDIFFEWVDVYRMCDNENDTKHMKALLDYFKQGRYIRSLYAWNTTTNRFEYLDGTPAYYKRK